jgi:hypothetical protein
MLSEAIVAFTLCKRMGVGYKSKLSLKFQQCTKKSLMRFRKTLRVYLINHWSTRTLITVLWIKLRKSQNFKLLKLPNDLVKLDNFLVQERSIIQVCRQRKLLQLLEKKLLET